MSALAKVPVIDDECRSFRPDHQVVDVSPVSVRLHGEEVAVLNVDVQATSHFKAIEIHDRVLAFGFLARPRIVNETRTKRDGGDENKEQGFESGCHMMILLI